MKGEWRDPTERWICHAVLFGFVAIVLLCLGLLGTFVWGME